MSGRLAYQGVELALDGADGLACLVRRRSAVFTVTVALGHQRGAIAALRAISRSMSRNAGGVRWRSPAGISGDLASPRESRTINSPAFRAQGKLGNHPPMAYSHVALRALWPKWL